MYKKGPINYRAFESTVPTALYEKVEKIWKAQLVLSKKNHQNLKRYQVFN